jgi:hypothetical protein
MASNGPDPVLIIKNHLPEHIRDLEAELDKAVAKVRDLQTDLAVARTLVAITPAGDGEDGSRG